MTQDLLLTGEKLWLATLRAIKALCTHRGWACADHDRAELLNLMKRFAAEKNNETIKPASLIATHCQANFQYDWMEFDDLSENRARVREQVGKLPADVSR